MIPLEEIFCVIDDFCKHFHQEQSKYALPNPKQKRKRSFQMTFSEVMTILTMFHFSHYRTFKDFYCNYMLFHQKKEFPKAVSYNHFVELMPMTFMPFFVFINALTGEKTEKYYIDSTKLPFCHNL